MKQEKSATNNQWVSTPVESKGNATCSKEKTAGNNQWTSTNKNPIDNK
ncbi:hypothetical protein [Clostridium baratii]|nr:hypothetical protein [Clostridium baratii]